MDTPLLSETLKPWYLHRSGAKEGPYHHAEMSTACISEFNWEAQMGSWEPSCSEQDVVILELGPAGRDGDPLTREG